jgi:hypothetical protein
MPKTDNNSQKSIEHKIDFQLRNGEDDAKFQAWCKTPSAIEALNAYEVATMPMKKKAFVIMSYLFDRSMNNEAKEQEDALFRMNEEFRKTALELIEKLSNDIPAAKQAGYEAAINKNKKIADKISKQDAAFRSGRAKGTAARVKKAKDLNEQFEKIMNDLFSQRGKGWEWRADQLFLYVKKSMSGAWTDTSLMKKIANKKAAIKKAQKSISDQ